LKGEALDCTVWRTGFEKRMFSCGMTDYGMMIMIMMMIIIIVIIIIYLPANGLSPGGSGYNACT
jgi:hypothetical protein